MSSDIINQHLVGNGSNTQFTLLTTVANTSSVLVSINGLLIDPDIDYTVASNIITFTNAPYNTSDIEIRYLPSLATGYTGSPGSPGGYSGSTGFNGSQGFIGYTGSRGFVGSIGFGYTGSQGTTGYAGSGGLGYTGSRGAGYTGSVGPLGAPSNIQTIMTDGTASYLLSSTPNSSKSILVAVNGLLQVPEADYTISGSNIVFNNVPPTGSDVEIIYFGNDVGYRGSEGFQGSAGFTGSMGIGGKDGYIGSFGYTGSMGFTGSIGTGYTGSSGVGVPSSYQIITSTGDPTYTLNHTIASAVHILVIVNGLVQVPDTDYSVLGTTLTFLSNIPVAASDIEILYFDIFNASNYIGYYGSAGYRGSVGYIGSVGRSGLANVFIGPHADANPFNGELWFDTDNGILSIYYQIDDTWVSIGPGLRGINGYTGSGGLGYTGSLGFTGSTGGGYTGSVGYQGSAGTSGYNGSNGYNGSFGFTGSIGYTGSKGDTGYIGSSGYNGSAGIGYTGSIGFVGSSGAIPLQEVVGVVSGGTTITFNCINSRIFDVTPSANFQIATNNLNLQSPGATNLVLLINQGSSAYIPSSISIDTGSVQSITWQGGLTPTGNPNKTDFISLTIYKKTSTYVIYGQLVSFG